MLKTEKAESVTSSTSNIKLKMRSIMNTIIKGEPANKADLYSVAFELLILLSYTAFP